MTCKRGHERTGTCHFGRELGRQRDGHMEYVSTTYGSRYNGN
ncbi:hypothetical protein HanXRQr2_Chr01g0010391 [Helianthus annuus]|nr:hypothetical protein HanXRQr2_Chr01g0010391 [Helianthus annuus]KAJ0895296.1 hypothetical protein HanPSC8_Chr09g0398891 [Helianthus annuus]KAJ0941996.1 hypothetical protein HanPSC8_Chr03g0086651 [Helianthus annuus]